MMYLLKRTRLTKAIFFIAADIFLITLAFLLSFLLRFEGQIPQQYFILIPRIIVLAIIFIIPTFYFQKLYSFSWSYVSASEAISLFVATTISFLFLGITLYISKYIPYFQNFPRSVIFISYILVFLFCSGVRFSKRIYFQVLGIHRIISREKTLIVGAGDAGEQILRNILSFKKSPYFPVGFVDDNQINQGIKIHGIKVLGKVSDIPRIVKDNKVSQLIIALSSAGSKAVKDAVELGRKSGIKEIKIFPPLSEIIKGSISFEDLRNVKVEDLLRRDSVSIDTNQIENLIKDKVVLITGAAGSIGSELSRQTARFSPSNMVLLDQEETGIFNISQELKYSFPNLKINSVIADIRDKEKINSIFKKYHPQIVFHAAAYKHVPLMEENPDEAIKNNVFGTEILAKASVENKVQNFIFISTDKSINPSSVMGATKRIGEMICQIYDSRQSQGSSTPIQSRVLDKIGMQSGQKNTTKFISVRFGNVLDSRGSVIPTFRQQIKRGGPVEVTHPEMKRYFMLISEACLLVMQAGAMGQGGEVFVLDMGKPIKILDLAKEMIRLSGFEQDKDIAIIFTGARPGEKLFEEILTAEEGVSVTQNQKIFIAKIFVPDAEKFMQKIEKLKNVLINQNKYDLIETLKEIVPFYKS